MSWTYPIYFLLAGIADQSWVPVSRRPTLNELRAVAQPPSVLGRRNAEHWVALLYTRRLSLRLTRVLVGTPVTADAVTYAMMMVGIAGGALLLVPGVPGALLAALAIQLYLLLDCVDGEIARWRHTTSERGVYLDRLGHYLVEASWFVFLGARIGGSWQSGWVSVGLAVSLLAVLAKIETDLVAATVGPKRNRVDAAAVTPKPGAIRLARAVTHPLRIHRATGAVEASMLVLVASVMATTVWPPAEQALLVFFAVVAALLVVGHGVAIVSSNRLQPDDLEERPEN